MAITREQIWAAADELDAAGQNPTLSAVRKAVGGGSFTTIQEAMTEWKARRASREASIQQEPAPQIITDRLQEVGREIWAAALELANVRLAAERQAMEAARQEMDGARQEAAELADQLTAELDEAKSQVENLVAAEAAARTEAEVLRRQLAAAEAKGAEIERQAESGRRELAEVRQVMAKAGEEVAILRGRLEAMETQNAALLARLAPA